MCSMHACIDVFVPNRHLAGALLILRCFIITVRGNEDLTEIVDLRIAA